MPGLWDILANVALRVALEFAREFFLRQPHRQVHIPEAIVQATGKSREQIIREARNDMGVDALHDYNIALVGQSGVGKSTLISALVGARVARANVVECTERTSRFDIPDCPYLKVWDLPGGGTQAHPATTYFMDKRIYAFDAVCILYSDRLDEVALSVAKGCLEYGKPFVFLRTKSGIMVDSYRRDHQIRDEAAAIAAARRAVLSHFHSTVPAPIRNAPHFFVDAYDMQDGRPSRFDEGPWLDWVRDECARRADPADFEVYGGVATQGGVRTHGGTWAMPAPFH